MREPLLPEVINKALQSGELSKEKALELLISLIESSEVAQIRSQSIETLDKVGIKINRIFKVLENALVSDENAIVRASAVRSIILNFIDNGLALLEWVIEHDKSPLVLQIVIDKIEKPAIVRVDEDELEGLKSEFNQYPEHYIQSASDPRAGDKGIIVMKEKE